MLHKLQWLPYFNVDTKQLLKYGMSGQGKQNLTAYALEVGILPQESYLKWASHHYDLLVLRDGCYIQDAQLWSKLPIKSVWNESCVPIHIWEGTLFVACVEPPNEATMIGLKRYCVTQFFLSPLSVVYKLWAQLDKQRQYFKLKKAS